MKEGRFPLQQIAPDRLFRPALIDTQFAEGIAYNEYAWAAERCAKALTESHPVEGRRVALAAASTVDLVLTLFGVWRAGGAALLVNPKLPHEAISAAMRHVDAVALLGSEYVRHPDAKPLVGLGGALDSVAEVLESHPFDWHRPATILMTSGSTGDAKYVVHSFANHYASARAANANMPLGPDDRWLLSLPLFHVAGIGVLMRCLVAGAAVVMPEPEEELAETIARRGATHVSLVATQLYRLLGDAAGRAALASLKGVLLGGSAVPESLLRDAHTAGVPIHTSYGMTETASQIACTPPGASLDTLHTSGRPLTEGTIRIVEDSVQVRGETLFRGYLNADGNIAAPFTPDGWFDTGDLGRFDDDGNLVITGRRDNQFISGGENIQPEEIERALLRIEGVAEAIIVPITDPEWGHRPVAFIRMRNASPPNANALHERLASTLPNYKLPIRYEPWPTDLAEGMKPSRAEFARIVESTQD